MKARSIESEVIGWRYREFENVSRKIVLLLLVFKICQVNLSVFGMTDGTISIRKISMLCCLLQKNGEVESGKEIYHIFI